MPAAKPLTNVARSARLPAVERWGIRLVRAFAEALFPARCQGCGAIFRPPEIRRVEADFERCRMSGYDPEVAFRVFLDRHLCPDCLADFNPAGSPLCTRCGAVFRSREGPDHLCGGCLAIPGKFRMARASGIYERVLMRLIHRFKYRGKLQLAKPLGWMLLCTFARYWEEGGIDIVIPVPLHGKKLRKRGFNQSYLLVECWARMAKACRLPFLPPVPDRNALFRYRSTAPQTGLGRGERKKNIRNAFRVEDPQRVSGKRVLLIDDVFTTGATVEECAGVLLRAGARQVDVLTLARAV